MRIGDETCYLLIERSNTEPWYAPVRIEARLLLDDAVELFAVNTRALISAGDEGRAAFTDFEECRSPTMVIRASDEVSLELRRDLHGHIDVLFSISYQRNAASWRVAGDVRVDGEGTIAFLQELRRVIFPDP